MNATAPGYVGYGRSFAPIYDQIFPRETITEAEIAWLTRQIDDVPDRALPPAPKFLKEPMPNLTGTPYAYRPSGALERGGRRARASGDYQAWTPD